VCACTVHRHLRGLYLSAFVEGLAGTACRWIAFEGLVQSLALTSATSQVLVDMRAHVAQMHDHVIISTVIAKPSCCPTAWADTAIEQSLTLVLRQGASERRP